MHPAKDIPADRPRSRTKSRGATASSETPEGLVLVTLKANTGAIVKIETVEPDGSRHELSASDTARLVAERPQSTLESLVHEAFEAGLACVLGDANGREAADEAADESTEDAELHNVLLGSLIAHSSAKRLLQREVLSSAMLGTIISQASNGHRAGAATNAAT
jgi:hypothetical protein